MKQSSQDPCLISWNVNNPDLDDKEIIITKEKIVVKDGRSIIAEMPFNNDLFHVTTNNKVTPPITANDVNFEYTLHLEQGNNILEIGNKDEQKLGNSFLLYKNKGNIAIVHDDEFARDANYYRNLPRCFNLYQVNIDTETKVIAYNPFDKEVKERDLIIQFAVLINTIDQLNLDDFTAPINEDKTEIIDS